jgi:hypothetical protein
VPRLVLGYVDYLGKLYQAGHKNFLIKIFGTIDPNYKKHGDLFWEIYRNGLMHSYQPKTLENRDQKISWLTYKDLRANPNLQRHFYCNRTSDLTYDHYHLKLTHLVPQKLRNSIWIQPISIVCLYGDLILAIERYEHIIAGDSRLEENFRNTANELLRSVKTTETWW